MAVSSCWVKDSKIPGGKETPKGEIRRCLNYWIPPAIYRHPGGPLEHVIAAKAVAFGEAVEPEYKTYQRPKSKQMRLLWQKHLWTKGYKIISDGTDNHSMLIDLPKSSQNGRQGRRKSTCCRRYHCKQEYGFRSTAKFGFPNLRYSCQELRPSRLAVLKNHDGWPRSSRSD